MNTLGEYKSTLHFSHFPPFSETKNVPLSAGLKYIQLNSADVASFLRETGLSQDLGEGHIFKLNSPEGKALAIGTKRLLVSDLQSQASGGLQMGWLKMIYN